MELVLHQRYTYDQAVDAFQEAGPPAYFCDGQFVVFSNAILCMTTVGTLPTESRFLSASRVEWKPQRLDYAPLDKIPWFPEPVRETYSVDRKKHLKNHHIFARLQGEETFLYAGVAHLFTYGPIGAMYTPSACFSLAANLTRSAWLAVGGSLLAPQPFKHLMTGTTQVMDLKFHAPAFSLLHITPQRSEEARASLNTLERALGHALPASVREWYSLSGVPEIMKEICMIHDPVTLDELLDADQGTNFYDPDLGKVALPLINENQAVWLISCILDGSDDPPVYLGYNLDSHMDWKLHAAHFSEFIHAWAWDYVVFTRDYCLDVTKHLTESDAERLKSGFDHGPTTYCGNAIYIFEQCDRYSRGDQKIILMQHDASRRHTWASAESGDSMAKLLEGPWSRGNVLARLGGIDLEMQKPYLW